MRDFDEQSLIALITRRYASPDDEKTLLNGVGDDCAVIAPPPKGMIELVTTDTLVEGVHFDRQYATPKQIGIKSAAVNLSDIAAMGGTPAFALLSLSITDDIDRRFITRFMDGFSGTLAANGPVRLVGGNVTAAPHDFSITVTVFGYGERNKVVTRGGAKTGDALYVTGTLGDAAWGLDFLLNPNIPPPKGVKNLIHRQLAPTPRTTEGAWLGNQQYATAMIDISDGLLLDATRIAEASKGGIVIEQGGIPLSLAVRRMVNADPATWDRIITGGEDYELLFTVGSRNIVSLEIAIRLGVIGATRIGRVIDRPAKGKPVSIINKKGEELTFDQPGWWHR
jgi:thiamine-monophosphate kinase